MFDAILPALHDMANGLVAKLFVGLVANRAKSTILTLRANNAKDRAVLRILESLDPFFRHELSESDASWLAHALKRRFENISITPDLIARHRFNLESVVAELAGGDLAPDTLSEQNLHDLLNRMTRQVCEITIAVAEIVPAWERSSWTENFKAFEDIQIKLEHQNLLINSFLSQPTERLRIFEEEYRRCVATDLRRINLRGIGNINDVRELSLKTSFIQLSLKRTATEDLLRKSKSGKQVRFDDKLNNRSNTVRSPVDVIGALSETPRIVIRGSPGSGKSTLAQFLALHAASGNPISIGAEAKQISLVPFLIKVRDLTDFEHLPRPKDFVELCARYLSGKDDEEFVQTVFRQQRALVIIDGLDECELTPTNISDGRAARVSEMDLLVRWIRNLADMIQGNAFVVTSRPVGDQKEQLLSAGFVEFEVLPLSELQQDEFIENWFQSIEHLDPASDQREGIVRAKSKAAALRRELASVQAVRALAYNPLMLSVICIVYKARGENLPARKMDLLNDCLNVLLFEWRRANGLKPSVIGDLDAPRLRSLLEPLAWKMTLDATPQLDEEDVANCFSSHLPEIGESPNRAMEILATIRDRTGVLVEESSALYAFTHLLFQDYLAAEECAHVGIHFDLLLSKANDPKWKELIPMIVAASKGNQETLIRGLLHVGAPAIAGRALAMLDRASIALRKETTEALTNFQLQLVTDFNAKDLAALVEVGTPESVQLMLSVLCQFPVIPAEEHFRYAADYKFSSNTQVALVRNIAIHTVARAVHWEGFDLGDEFGRTRAFEYFNEGSSIPRGVSWSCLNLGLWISDASADASIDGSSSSSRSTKVVDNSVYKYAVLLDTCDAHRGYLRSAVWEAFEIVTAQDNLIPEQRLLLLHLTWYLTDPNERIANLLSFLESFPRNVYPAFQIGLLNNAMSRLNHDTRTNNLERAKRIWNEALDTVEMDLLRLIEVWRADLRLTSETESSFSSATELKEAFRLIFASERATQTPFDGRLTKDTA